jgi:crossover junction endodeoxyribonuclease RuvC
LEKTKRVNNRKSSSVYILGIDPGVNRIGYSQLKVDNKKITITHTGTIKPNLKGEFIRKLKFITEETRKLIDELKPDIVAVEEIYLGKNVKIALKIGQVTGVIAGYILAKGIEMQFISPKEVKKNLTGTGSAEKEQVKFMVESLTGYSNFKNTDESDAAAVAISYLNIRQENDLLYPG